LASAVDVDIFYIDAAGESRNEVEPHAENASVGHPEERLRVKRDCRGKCSRAKTVTGAVAQVIVLARSSEIGLEQEVAGRQLIGTAPAWGRPTTRHRTTGVVRPEVAGPRRRRR
jgi:hypothetical protein